MEDQRHDPARVRRFVERFGDTLGADQVLVGDACFAYAIDGREPAVVLFPDSVDAVASALEVASSLDAAVAPWGGGTQMALGYPLERLDVVISLERLNRVITHSSLDGTVTVQAGCTITALNEALASTRQHVALDGPLSHRSTVGGRLATGNSGLRRGAYGHTRDLVLGLQIVRSDGTVTFTGGAAVKNVIGYDLNKLLVGSLGTLGIIVEATLRTSALPDNEATVVASFDDPTSIWGMLTDLDAAQILPTALVAVGPGCLGAGHGLSDELADMIEPAAHPVLLARLSEPPNSLRRHALAVRNFAMKYGAIQPLMVRGDAMHTVWKALDDLPETMELLSTEAVLKVAVLPSEINKVVEVTRSFSEELVLRFCWEADANTGIVWLRMADDASDDERFGQALAVLQESLARRWRSSMVLGCAPSIKQHLSLWGADPHGLELMRAIKSRFDPSGILNPGRFVGHI